MVLVGFSLALFFFLLGQTDIFAHGTFQFPCDPPTLRLFILFYELDLLTPTGQNVQILV